jgi:hypothetical protein
MDIAPDGSTIYTGGAEEKIYMASTDFDKVEYKKKTVVLWFFFLLY